MNKIKEWFLNWITEETDCQSRECSLDCFNCEFLPEILKEQTL